MNKTVIYERKINFYETDAQGIVHHSNYPRYFEEARGYFLEKANFPYQKIREDLKVDIVLLELNVKYRKPLKFGDICSIEITLNHMDRYFFSFSYKVLKGEEIFAEGYTKHCCIDRNSKKMISIPKKIKQLFSNG